MGPWHRRSCNPSTSSRQRATAGATGGRCASMWHPATQRLQVPRSPALGGSVSERSPRHAARRKSRIRLGPLSNPSLLSPARRTATAQLPALGAARVPVGSRSRFAPGGPTAAAQPAGGLLARRERTFARLAERTAATASSGVAVSGRATGSRAVAGRLAHAHRVHRASWRGRGVQLPRRRPTLRPSDGRRVQETSASATSSDP